MPRNDEYPTTKGMTNEQVDARQLASRRVTVTERRVPTMERLSTPKRYVTDVPDAKYRSL